MQRYRHVITNYRQNCCKAKGRRVDRLCLGGNHEHFSVSDFARNSTQHIPRAGARDADPVVNLKQRAVRTAFDVGLVII